MSDSAAGFEFEVPVWVLVHEAGVWDQGLPGAVLHMTEGHAGPPMWPLFTNVAKAKAFADAAPVTAGVIPMALGGMATVCGLLADLIDAGYEQVVIDPSYGEGDAQTRIPAREFLGYLRADDE